MSQPPPSVPASPVADAGQSSTSCSLRPSQSASQTSAWGSLSYSTAQSVRNDLLKATAIAIREKFPLLQFLPGDQYIMWTPETHSQFYTWWLTTPAFEKVEAKDSGKHKDPQWNKAKHELWTNFDQIASTMEGDPKLRCKNCGVPVEHPTHSANSGTTNIKNHLSSSRCISKKRQS